MATPSESLANAHCPLSTEPRLALPKLSSAIAMSTLEATILGVVYTLARAIYPLLLPKKMGKDIPARLLVATFTGYLVLTAMAVRIMLFL